jgi:cyclopropane fatty-acyl-phospholipid synthase-like methyltransferase
MQSMYEEGSVPWDEVDPPPEVKELAGKLPAGRALDLGSGLGRAAIYLASLGWQVDGVDFVAKAVSEAQTRANQAGVAERVRFHHSPVTNLDFLGGLYDFALDVGCAHGFSGQELVQYHQELKRLLKPGAIYLLFAHLNNEEAEQEEQRWLDENQFKAIFSDGFCLEKETFGTTQVKDQDPWRSAWFWFKRTSHE